MRDDRPYEPTAGRRASVIGRHDRREWQPWHYSAITYISCRGYATDRLDDVIKLLQKVLAVRLP